MGYDNMQNMQSLMQAAYCAKKVCPENIDYAALMYHTQYC